MNRKHNLARAGRPYGLYGQIVNQTKRTAALTPPGASGFNSAFLKPVFGQGLADVRTVSGEFLLDLQRYWRQEGWRILVEVGQKYPELVDAALEWLIKNKVIKREQRGDAAAILSGISDWLERAQNE